MIVIGIALWLALGAVAFLIAELGWEQVAAQFSQIQMPSPFISAVAGGDVATTGHVEVGTMLPRIAAILVTAPVAIAGIWLASTRFAPQPGGWLALAGIAVAAFLAAVVLTYPIFASVAIS